MLSNRSGRKNRTRALVQESLHLQVSDQRDVLAKLVPVEFEANSASGVPAVVLCSSQDQSLNLLLTPPPYIAACKRAHE